MHGTISNRWWNDKRRHSASTLILICSFRVSAWNHLWETDNIRWDLNGPSPPLVELLSEQKFPISAKNALVPGCGNGYDVFYLAQYVEHVMGIDIAPIAIERCQRRLNSYLNSGKGPKNVAFRITNFFNDINVLQPDFYDLVYDYTFLCALPPPYRPAWAARMCELIKSGGLLVAICYPMTDSMHGPPFALRPDV